MGKMPKATGLIQIDWDFSRNKVGSPFGPPC